MITTIKHLLFVTALLLLCGFFWPKANWQSVNKFIDKSYPDVASISTNDLKNQLQSGDNLTIIDVRPHEEYTISHLPGAINITNVKKLTLPKNSQIVVYCSVGIRSAHFAKKMNEQGYTNVSNLRGSIFEWANHGYPLKRGEQSVNVVHPYNKKWGRLLNAPLHRYSIKE